MKFKTIAKHTLKLTQKEKDDLHNAYKTLNTLYGSMTDLNYTAIMVNDDYINEDWLHDMVLIIAELTEYPIELDREDECDDLGGMEITPVDLDTEDD